ncbi:hypothetical protein MSIBF_A620008 [groundwater metagenome]|uniref:Uncharacterized protein n=1 Tax=groundwater metagenome TaxID=717931 RepID=A0A098EEE4_9ZZZZ
MKFSKNYRKSTRFSIFKNLKIFKLPVIFGWLNSYYYSYSGYIKHSTN